MKVKFEEDFPWSVKDRLTCQAVLSAEKPPCQRTWEFQSALSLQPVDGHHGHSVSPL